MLSTLVVVVGLLSVVVNGFTPLVPTDGYTYTVEAAREKAWPSCPYRFLSYSSDSSDVDLWKGAGGNQHWQFLDSGRGDGTFYLKTNFNKFLSYSGDCDVKVVDLWSQAGVNQAFRFIPSPSGQFQFFIEAVGRANCGYKYLSFPVGCTTNTPDKIDLWNAAGADQTFRIYPISSTNPAVQKVGTSFVCPDPYVWKPQTSSNYLIQCTGGGILMGSSPDLDPATSQFDYIGDCLGGEPAEWAAYNENESRWAPENYETPDGKYNYVFFSDTQLNDKGNHRLGWVMSSTGAVPNAYTKYSPNYLDLGNAPGGDIDSTIFRDSNDGKTYIVWKTDDNAVGDKVTRIWSQELIFTNETVYQVGKPVVLMDSTGLWWVDSWVEGGSLVEGPEIVQEGGYYYLFFAAGKFCQDTYTQGVARSKSFFGPYEKMTSPVLTNGIVGVARNSAGVLTQLVGPGHAAFAKDSGDGQWRIVYHASIGQNCARYAFVNKLVFGADGWPYVNL